MPARPGAAAEAGWEDEIEDPEPGRPARLGARPAIALACVSAALTAVLFLLLDRGACRAGSTREELVLALLDEDAARRYEERHGVSPRDAAGLIGRLLGG